MSKLQFVNTKDIYRFSPVLTHIPELEDLYEEILQYCDIIKMSHEDQGKFWRIWLATMGGDVVGMLGIHCTKRVTTDVWITYFGMIPHRDTFDCDLQMLKFMEGEAKKNGFKRIIALAKLGDRDQFIHADYNILDRAQFAEMFSDEKEVLAELGNDYAMVKNI